MITDPILTAIEIAAELRCSKSQVYKLLNGSVDGLKMIPHLALGRKKVVPRSAFETWKRQNVKGMLPADPESTTMDAVH